MNGALTVKQNSDDDRRVELFTKLFTACLARDRDPRKQRDASTFIAVTPQRGVSPASTAAQRALIFA